MSDRRSPEAARDPASADTVEHEIPVEYEDVADAENWRSIWCPACDDPDGRAYYVEDIGVDEDNVHQSAWVTSCCATPITLYQQGKGADFVDEQPDVEVLDDD